jgi:hypothetical protein
MGRRDGIGLHPGLLVLRHGPGRSLADSAPSRAASARSPIGRPSARPTSPSSATDPFAERAASPRPTTPTPGTGRAPLRPPRSGDGRCQLPGRAADTRRAARRRRLMLSGPNRWSHTPGSRRGWSAGGCPYVVVKPQRERVRGGGSGCHCAASRRGRRSVGGPDR